jgi:uncharacterized protein
VRSWWPVALTVAVLIGSNIVSNRVLQGWSYVPWNTAVAVTLILVTRRFDGLRRMELGLTNIGRGLRSGAMLMAAVAAIYGIGLLIPSTRDLFRDRRVGDRSALRMLAEVVIRIPIGTVVLEEVAFRGVLLGQLGRRLGWRTGLASSSVLFGMWHVLPAISINTVNPVLKQAGIGQAPAVMGAVAATAAAGVFMGWVRIRARSLIAPVMLHIATNSFGFAIAWAVLRST